MVKINRVDSERTERAIEVLMREKAKNGDPVEREKCNKNEQNSIGKENIVRTKLGCKNRPNDYFTNDDY